MNSRIALLLLPLALAACTPKDQATEQAGTDATTPAAEPAAPSAKPPAPASTPAPAAPSAVLAGHTWKLDSATDAQGKRIDALFPSPKNVLTLGFADGSVSVSGGCNRMGGGFELDAQNQLKVGPMRATMMACAPPLMQADAAIGKLFEQPQQLRIEEGTPPRLHLASSAGNSVWVGEATPETRFGGPGERVFLEVAPQRVACNHPLIPNHQCLQVREIKFDDKGIRQQPPGEWQSLYEDIEGFEFQEGQRTVLRLNKFKRPEPVPADASSVVYVLDMVVESEIVPQGK